MAIYKTAESKIYILFCLYYISSASIRFFLINDDSMRLSCHIEINILPSTARLRYFVHTYTKRFATIK